MVITATRVLLYSACIGALIADPLVAQDVNRPARLKTHRPTVSGVHGLVTSGHPLASMAGVRTLIGGGNAADAAVAVLATLNLTEPMMSGAGGNGFMTIYDRASGRTYSLNATGAAPLAIDPTQVTPDELARGMKAGVVPGLFGGWIALLDRFGTKSLTEVLQPAIEYAQNGHPLDPYVATSIAKQKSLFERFPSSARVLLPGGQPPPRVRCSNIQISRTPFRNSSRPKNKRCSAGSHDQRRCEQPSTASTRAPSPSR